ncbi:YjcZ family sporulation protein [Pseudalkalibacillus berkeleyi]|uniref:YjcZ family sporulation protein n=1 Tax=Pseudalkalibacillus berkeleyi TaxID=1069813 RepID=A0ABS9H1D2_9BACL|nr:YjcZ family sporulation protein [Pseudalkalibacillus berkeleyi]MCF6137630.1 YjcZ family sporulation protein [Pseudalkalibacillus berkeleyi]
MSDGFGKGFILLVVLFVLLVIIGVTVYSGSLG